MAHPSTKPSVAFTVTDHGRRTDTDPLAAAEAAAQVHERARNLNHQRLVDIERDARSAATLEALHYAMANLTWKAVNARQAFVFATQPALHKHEPRWRLVCMSSLARVDHQARAVQWMESLGTLLSSNEDMVEAHIAAFDTPDKGMANQYPFPFFIWQKLRARDGRELGALLLTGLTPWQDDDVKNATRLCETFAHAWEAFVPKPTLLERFRPSRRLWTLAGLFGLSVAMFPVAMTALAPAEIIPADPFVVAAPIDGVIDTIEVEPSSPVKAGQVLVRFVDTTSRNALEIAEREVMVAQAKWKQMTQGAFLDPNAKREMAIAQAELALKTAERDYARDIFEKSIVRAPHAGLAVFADKREWIGKPVSVGQRLMEIADPSKIELKINLAVEDSSVLETGARVRAFLDQDPLNPLEGTIKRASHNARINESGQLALRADASLKTEDNHIPRIGIRATAQVYGGYVPLAFYLLRRPITYLRQRVGL